MPLKTSLSADRKLGITAQLSMQNADKLTKCFDIDRYTQRSAMALDMRKLFDTHYHQYGFLRKMTIHEFLAHCSDRSLNCWRIDDFRVTFHASKPIADLI